MRAFVRHDLVREGLVPPIIGKVLHDLPLASIIFESFQPDDLDNEEFNLILKSPSLQDGFALAISIDFDFID